MSQMGGQRDDSMMPIADRIKGSIY